MLCTPLHVPLQHPHQAFCSDVITGQCWLVNGLLLRRHYCLLGQLYGTEAGLSVITPENHLHVSRVLLSPHGNFRRQAQFPLLTRYMLYAFPYKCTLSPRTSYEISATMQSEAIENREYTATPLYKYSFKKSVVHVDKYTGELKNRFSSIIIERI